MVATLNVNDAARLLDTAEGQQLKDFEDDITDVLLVLASTAETLSSLLENYRQYYRSSSLASQDLPEFDLDVIHCALLEKQRDICNYRQKMESLRNKVMSTTQLVSDYSSLLPTISKINALIAFKPARPRQWAVIKTAC